MDRSEAIAILEREQDRAFERFWDWERVREAYDLAIEALQESQTTHDQMDACYMAQKQVTGKLKNPCDSLLKSDADECKEQKSKLDCISRQEVLGYIDRLTNSGLGKAKSLEYIKKYVERMESSVAPKPVGDCISRQQAIEAMCRECVHGGHATCSVDCTEVAVLHNLPPVTPTEQTIKEIMDFIGGMNMVGEISNKAYAKISDFVDDGTPTERTTETMIVDGMEMEIDPVSYEVGYSHGQTAPTERTGEWIPKVGHMDEIYTTPLICSECGVEVITDYDNYCPYCGAKMGEMDNE